MKYIIDGPNVACGKVIISGAKNFSIKALAAAVLVKGKVSYNNVPRNLDVMRTLNMLKNIGCEVETNFQSKSCFVDSSNISNVLDDQDNANMIMFLFGAALMHRFDYVQFPKNQGCNLGHRAFDFHVMAFEKFGAIYDRSEQDFHIFRKKAPLKGCLIELPYTSVGATETAIFLGVLANGVTKICNAAIEPEVQALVTALVALGANVFFERDRTIIVHGVNELYKDSLIEIHGDLLEAATWGVLAAASHGSIEVEGIVPELVGSFFGIFSIMGGKIKRTGPFSVEFSKKQQVQTASNILIETGVFPSLRTDLQPLLAALGALQLNSMAIHETVYDRRLDYLESFKEFGVNITGFYDCFGTTCRFHNKTVHSAIINGIDGELKAPDHVVKAKTIRSGMAEIILACVAKGQTVIDDVEVVERGYCNLFEKLKSFGIKIKVE